MALSAGSKLGPYEILSLVGAGGMGEVYRAKDTRLDRTVAIKILPEHLSSNPDLKQRFDREARTISSLSHPHICALHDIGHQDGIDFLVMEFLEGESLAHRLDKGALTTEVVLRYGIQIAEALDKAHRQGIIHRDLKPGNIMLTKSGVKLLDFGLAKLSEQPPIALSGVSALATEQPKNLTAEGTILGTVQYMAPEQLEGKETDTRTDIFAFGSVLYEMATAKKAFTGKSQASLISAILKDEPAPISQIQTMSPTPLDHVVKKCLAKDPEDRWQTAHDIGSELKWIGEAGSSTSVPSRVLSSRRTRERILWGVLVAALVLALCGLGVAYFQLQKESPQAIRFSIGAPEGTVLDAAQVTISPDGSTIAFTATSRSDGIIHLWLRHIDSLACRQLEGTEGADSPFWSPDSRKVGFFADGKLKITDISEGQPVTLCDAPDGRGGAWSRDGIIVFSPDKQSALYQVSETGGASVAITALDKSRNEDSHRWPHFLPDGRHFLYWAWSGEEQNGGIYCQSVGSSERKYIFAGDSTVAYASSYLFFVRRQQLVAQPFNTNKLEVSGKQFTVAENVGRGANGGGSFSTGYSPFSVSENGVLVYGRARPPDTQLTWFDRSGKVIESVGPVGSYSQPAFSPDQKHIAVDVWDPNGNLNIWLLNLSQETLSRFTFSIAGGFCACWSPDGTRIVYSSNRGGGGRAELYARIALGGGNEERLLQSNADGFCDDWTRDGRYIVFERVDPRKGWDLWAMPTFGNKKPFPILQTDFNEAHSRISPDLHWVAYTSDESGKSEVYIRTFPNTASGKWQISSAGGDQPQWQADGKELFYVSTDGKLMAVEVQADTAFAVSVAKPLFQANMAPNNLNGWRNNYLVSADGQRFLINEIVEKKSSSPITVVINWPALLKY